MPYIPPEDRAAYDATIDALAGHLAAREPARRQGHANYVITQILRKAWGLQESENESYASYADVVGTLECAKLEIYRRWVAAYEDTAIARHGDL